MVKFKLPHHLSESITTSTQHRSHPFTKNKISFSTFNPILFFSGVRNAHERKFDENYGALSRHRISAHFSVALHHAPRDKRKKYKKTRGKTSFSFLIKCYEDFPIIMRRFHWILLSLRLRALGKTCGMKFRDGYRLVRGKQIR